MVAEGGYAAVPLTALIEDERDVEEKRIGRVKIEAWLGNNNNNYFIILITKLWVGIIKATSVNLWMGIVATINNWYYY